MDVAKSRLLSVFMTAAATACLMFASPAYADDSCAYSNDGECDEPTVCPTGTDSADCAGAASETPLAEESDNTSLDTSTSFGPEEGDLVSLFAWSNQLGWVFDLLLLAAAFMLWKTRQFPGRKLLAAGLLLMSVPGLLLRFYGGELGTGGYAVLRAVSIIAPSLLVIAGVVLLRRWLGHGGAPASGAWTAAGSADSPSLQQVLRSESNALTAATKEIESLETRFRAALTKLGIPAEVFRTTPFNSEQSLRIVLNELRSASMGVRASLQVNTVLKEYHRYPFELAVTVTTSLRTRTIASILSLQDQEIEHLCEYLASRVITLKFAPLRAREHSLQLWRPRNKVVAIKPRRWPVYVAVAVIAGLFTVQPAAALAIGLVALIGWVIAFSYFTKAPLVLSPGRPAEEPRRLVRLDSWQAAVTGLAQHAEPLRRAFVSEIEAAAKLGSTGPVGADYGAGQIRIGEETIWYDSIEGKIERPQTVIRLRRGIVFVHAYGYGPDGYFAWDAHINGGSWGDTLVASGVHTESGKRVVAYAPEPRWTAPNEYDLTDANFLLELVHANLTKAIRRAMREQQIEQEIDFTIVREARAGVVGREDPEAARRKPSRLRRTA